MKDLHAFHPRKKERLLTAAQRKALEARVRELARNLERKHRKVIEDEKEPAAVAKARAIVEKWEEGQDAKIERLSERLHDEVKQIISNLLFDSVESSLLQVDEFEERKAI